MKASILYPSLLAGLLMASSVGATTPPEQLAAFQSQSGVTADPARGQQLFTQKHGREWSCSSCHTTQPTAEGQHASTGKRIAPLAPSANPQRFTDAAKTEKWFRRNCKDVVGASALRAKRPMCWPGS